MKRPKLSTSAEANLMFSNNHICCICREKGRDVQVHHIDGDPSNNRLSNLAVLCLDCHSRVTGSRGLGKSYTISEVRQYKRDWEFRIRKGRGMMSQPFVKYRRIELDMMRFELRKIVYELASASRRHQVKEKLELLETWYLYETEPDYVLESLHATVPNIASNKNGSLVADYVPHFFYHLPGPDYSPIRKKDKDLLVDGVELLEWLGEFAAEFTRNATTAKSCIDGLRVLSQIAVDYNQERIVNRSIRAVNKIRKGALTKYEGESALRSVATYSDRIAEHIRKDWKDRMKK